MCAKANSRYDAVEPTSPTISTGRRPNRSEMPPQTGTATSCRSEKLVTSRPIAAGATPKVAA